MSDAPLKITELCLRDAHQSLLATRMRLEDMLPIAEKLDQVGFWSVEMWGGATFDSAMRFLDEDPWERLRRLKAAMPRTRFQMLLRGQNVVGYRHYPDDIVERFVERAHANGIDVFRIFDALNDVRNMRLAMEVAKRVGAHVQAAISYTLGPVYSVDIFVEMGKELAGLGADSICVKDMAGLLTPGVAFELVARLKAEVGLPVQMHSHSTSGMATAVLVKSAEAGVDVVDTAISALSEGTSHPPTETLVSIFRGTPRDTGLDLNLLAEIGAYFWEVRKKYRRFESLLPPVDVGVLQFQIPGGMLSNLVSQLREQKAEHRLQEVLEEVPRVRAELGYPPLVTPSSQIVGVQATLNVLLGERYKVITEEVKNYVRGLYGRPPGPIDPEVKRLAIGDEEPITCRPADLIPPGYERAAEEIGDLARSEEDVLAYALFPQVARPFLERRATGKRRQVEVAAAVAAFLARQQEREELAPAAATPAGRTGGSPWKLAGRPGRILGGWTKW